MIPNNLTAMDFDSIKSSIKDYLRTREEFTDYDFEGSTLSYLVDVLAYNTYYTAFNANMAVNETFLSSATIRDNVVSLAKTLNYTPRSSRAAKACVSFTVQSALLNDTYPQYVSLKKGITATGGAYTFNVLEDVNATTDTNGVATFNKVVIYEGSILTYRYTVSSFKKQKYLIPTDKVDTSTLRITVKPNAQSTQEDVYVLGEDVTNIKADSRVYFLSETEDQRYEIIFGDGVIGRKLQDGEVINISYIKSHEAAANDVQDFDFVGELEDQYARVIDSIVESQLGVNERSQFGDSVESIESIKYTAPRDYTTQLRAVTSQDYSIITKKVYSNAESVIAFGGDELDPPVYGKVYVAIKTKTGNLLNNATKLSIAKDLRAYSMASIEPVIIDPSFLYVANNLFVLYDPTKTSKSISELQSLVLGAIEQYAAQENINNFDSSFSLSKFNKAIGLADASVDSASVQTTLMRYMTMNANTSSVDTYCIDFGQPLYDSNPSNDSGDGTGGTGSTCYKEPIIRSGQFITTDRPTVIQYFEDDGFGNLRTYYNSGSSKIYTNNAAGSINYLTGKVCFGPVAIDNPPGGGLLPVQVIPQNPSEVRPDTPGTIISLPTPDITVVPIGTLPPATIPLNNLNPEQYAVVPAVVTPVTIDNAGDLNNMACF